MTYTTFGRLTGQHVGARVEFVDRAGMPRMGVLGDVAHYSGGDTDGTPITSAHLEGERAAVFMPRDTPIEILDVDEPASDALVDASAAYVDGALALAAASDGAWLRSSPTQVARVVIDSAWVSIMMSLAESLGEMRAGLLAQQEVTTPDYGDGYNDAQHDVLGQVIDWLGEVMPDETKGLTGADPAADH
jgi:hypothetical protein